MALRRGAVTKKSRRQFCPSWSSAIVNGIAVSLITFNFRLGLEIAHIKAEEQNENTNGWTFTYERVVNGAGAGNAVAAHHRVSASSPGVAIAVGSRPQKAP
jgi:hypothetical protein